MEVNSTVIPGPKFMGHCTCGIYWGSNLPVPDIRVGDIVRRKGNFFKVTKFECVEHTCEDQKDPWVAGWAATLKKLRGKNARSLRRQQAKAKPWYVLPHLKELIK